MDRRPTAIVEPRPHIEQTKPDADYSDLCPARPRTAGRRSRRETKPGAEYSDSVAQVGAPARTG